MFVSNINLNSYLFSTLDQTTSIAYLESLYTYLARLLEHKYKENESCTPAVSAVIGISLNSCSENRERLPEFLKQHLGTLDELRQYHLEIILRSLDNVSLADMVEPERRHYYGIHLECMVGYSDLLMIHPRLGESRSNLPQWKFELITGSVTSHLSDSFKLRGVIDTAEPRLVSSDLCGLEYLSVRLARLELVLGSRDIALHPSVDSACSLLDQCKINIPFDLRRLTDACSAFGEQLERERISLELSPSYYPSPGFTE